MPVAIITGASSGIGEALARELHRRGWSVGLIARRAELLQQISGSLGSRAAWAAADVCDGPALEAAMLALEAALGPPDLVVANAGIGGQGHALDLRMETLTQTMRTNVEGPVRTLLLALPGMKARGQGHLAGVSSVAGVRGLPGTGVYSASKAALSTILESFRVDLRPHNIAVTTINPGYVVSPMTAKNRFKMPWLMPTERAARIIADGLERRRTEINFPWQMAFLYWLARQIPNFLYDRLMQRANPRKRREAPPP